MRFTHADATMAECRRRVVTHEWRRRRDGIAPWTIRTRDERLIVGWGGLYIDPFEPGWGLEIGYYFLRDAWGCGYATELVAACIALADRTLVPEELQAFAHPDNAASCRVLLKSGFVALRLVPELDRVLYHRPRPGE